MTDQGVTMEDPFICQYCDEELTGPGSKHTWIALHRDINPRSPMNDAVCMDGECLNPAGYVTKHNPIGWPARS